MARITPQTARLLADERIRAGLNRVSERDALIRQMLAQSEATGDASPETAIGAALMMARPRTVSPAAPAPMQPGVPFVAPKPTAEMLPTQMAQMAAQPQPQELPVAPQRPAPRSSRYRPMLNAALADIAAAQDAMAGQKPDKMAQIRIETLRSKAQQLQDLVQAEEGPEAEIPEEMRAAMEGRQARLTRREELLAEAKARSPFEALLAAGAAGAQGRRGETDIEAITRILQAGFGSYGQARRAGEEGAEGIAEARDQAMIDRYNMQERAREAALARARDIQGMGRETREEAIREVRLPTQLRGEEAGTALAEFNLREAPVEAASVRALRAAQAAYYRDRPDRAGSKVDVEGRQNRDELDKANADYEAARAEYNLAIRDINKSKNAGDLTPEEKINQIDSEVKTKFLQAEARLKALSRAYERTGQKSPYFSGQPQGAAASNSPPVAGARLAPDGKYYVPDPKRPGKYKQVVY